MKENELLLSRYGRKDTKRHEGRIITERSNQRWCSDAFEIQCWDGEKLRLAFALDCCDREILAWKVSRKPIRAEIIQTLLLEAMETRFGKATHLPHSIEWFSDNGPPYTAHETKRLARELGFKVCTTPAYSPESNGMSEAFVKTFKRDYVSVNELSDSSSVLRQWSKWFEDYNENHPHQGLKMMSPRQYRKVSLMAA